MKKINWIIENFTRESSYAELAEAVTKTGHNLLQLNSGYKKDQLTEIAGPTIFQGSIEMSKLVYKELKGRSFPILYCDWNKYKCSSYYSYFGNYLFNDKYCLMSLAEIGRQRWMIYGTFGKEGLVFIRPDSGDKPFQAQLVDMLDLDRFLKQHDHLKHELVLVSTPKNISWEGRFIVSRNKEIIGHSTYYFQKQITKIPSVPPGSLSLCKEILKNIDYIPDSVYCIDLCQAENDEFYLMELTSFSSAGLYSSNKDHIVEKVSEIVFNEYDKLEQESRAGEVCA